MRRPFAAAALLVLQATIKCVGATADVELNFTLSKFAFGSCNKHDREQACTLVGGQQKSAQFVTN
jgi:hypothetical protein